MKSRTMTYLLLSIFMIFLADASVFGEDYEALKGVQSVKAIFDFRIGNPESAVVHLDLIQQTFKDKSIRNVTKDPEFVVVFIGPSVKLVSTNTAGFSDKEKESLKRVAEILRAMKKDGIRLEICMFAAHFLGVAPATILPEIHQVGNGWISLTGYQAKGYSLVPAY